MKNVNLRPISNTIGYKFNKDDEYKYTDFECISGKQEEDTHIELPFVKGYMEGATTLAMRFLLPNNLVDNCAKKGDKKVFLKFTRKDDGAEFECCGDICESGDFILDIGRNGKVRRYQGLDFTIL